MLLLVPVTSMFFGMLSDNGRTRIKVEQLTRTLGRYSGRQPWMELISKDLQNRLESGCIRVSYDAISHYMNVKLESEKDREQASQAINKITLWMVNEQPDRGIIDLLREIIPNDEIGRFHRIPLRAAIMSVLGKNMKTAIGVALLLVTLLVRPDLVEKIVSLWKALL